MGLLIRSQNKAALIKVEMLGITGGIIHSYLGTNKTTLGEYKTNERALEVLDEIQSILETNKLFELYSNIGEFPDDFNKKYNYVEVYEMPKG